MYFILQLFSCSIGNVDRISCSSSSDCNKGFCTGYICSENGEDTGYCVIASSTERCFHTTPSDAYDDLSSYVLLGSLYDSSYDLPTIKAMDLAVSQANSIDSLGERKIALIHCDIRYDSGNWMGLSGKRFKNNDRIFG